MEEHCETVVVKPKKQCTSRIWLYFGFDENDEAQSKVLCRFCKRRVAAKGGNTSNLYVHLKIHHPIEYAELQERIKTNERHLHQQGIPSTSKQQSASDTVSNQSTHQSSILNSMSYEKSSKRWVTLTNAVTQFLAKDMLPFYTVEKEGFNRMLKAFDSRYNLPGRKYFSSAIPKLYQTVHDQILEEVSMASFYAGTTDLWSSKVMEPYMSYTIHYIDQDWNLISRHLQTIFFPVDHTGENIALGLKDTLDSWELDEDKQICLTTDNGSNIVKACELNDWNRLQCFGHRLHLAVNCGLKDDRVDRAIKVCKRVISAFSYSWKKKRQLKKVQTDLDLPTHSLITSCDTRWGSTQKMIKRFLEQENAIKQVLLSDRKSCSLQPSWQDLDVLEAVNKAVEPIIYFTDALSGENHVNISMVMPVLQLLNDDILAPKPDDVALTIEIKSKILNYLNDKYSDEKSTTRSLLSIASFLDPRFKNKFLSSAEDESTQIKISRELTDNTDSDIELVACDPSSSELPPSKKMCLGTLFKRHDDNVNNDSLLTESELISNELNRYLALPKADYESNPLEWWKQNCLQFPKMSRLAKKYLCIPATSCPSERLFSTSGNIVSCKRTCLNPDKVNQLVFLARNLQL